MKEDLVVKGAQGYEHTSTKVASYVTECKGSATLSQCLDVLNSYRKKLLSECNEKEIVEAKKRLRVHVQSIINSPQSMYFLTKVTAICKQR